MKVRVRVLLSAAATLATAAALLGQPPPQLGDAVRPFVAIDTPVVALTNVRIIDGTGGPAREHQTLVLRDGNIAASATQPSSPCPKGHTSWTSRARPSFPGS